jgi:hypothetical protein
VYSLCRVTQAERNNNFGAESFRPDRALEVPRFKSPRACHPQKPAKPQELTIEAKRYGAEKRKTNMRCPSCHLLIDPKFAWKSSTKRFYCSEFCADSEISAPLEPCAQKEVHDRLERLRRLLPLFEELKSNRMTPQSAGAVQ